MPIKHLSGPSGTRPPGGFLSLMKRSLSFMNLQPADVEGKTSVPGCGNGQSVRGLALAGVDFDRFPCLSILVEGISKGLVRGQKIQWHLKCAILDGNASHKPIVSTPSGHEHILSWKALEQTAFFPGSGAGLEEGKSETVPEGLMLTPVVLETGFEKND